MKFMLSFIIAFFVLSTSVEARPRHHGFHRHHYAKVYRDYRPTRWCGWQMRQWFGGGTEYNLARNWARFGSPARGPAPGVIVVWWRHVGLITGQGYRGWIVRSGNDGGRLRERERSLRGAIAFRWPQGGMRRYAMR